MLSTFSELRLNFLLTFSIFIANDFFAIITSNLPYTLNIQDKGILFPIKYNHTNNQCSNRKNGCIQQ